jgi:xanthine dehydrogenase accessory factor
LLSPPPTTPGEIAVSILAEILAVRNGRQATPLRRTVEDLTVIRGAGDLATGIAARLVRSGFPVVCLETAVPTVIRRSVSFAQALFDGETTVEGIRAVRAETVEATYAILERGDVPVLVDPEVISVDVLKPTVLVDAIIAKRNLGTPRGAVGDIPVASPLSGLVRGLLADGIEVTEGFKIGDVDPRGASVDWKTISDKARAIAGGVLEAMLHLSNRRPASVSVDVGKGKGGHVE